MAEATITGYHAHVYFDEPTVEQARAYHEATYSIGMGAGRLFDRQVDLTGRRKILDLGGGWPMSYTDGESPEIEAFAEALVPLLEERNRNGLRIVLEPLARVTIKVVETCRKKK